MSSLLDRLLPSKTRLLNEHAWLSEKVDDLHNLNRGLESRVDAVQREHAETKKILRETQEASANKDFKIEKLQTQINTPKKNAKIRTLVVSAASLVVGLGGMCIASALDRSNSSLLAGAVGIVAAVATNCFCQLYMRW